MHSGSANAKDRPAVRSIYTDGAPAAIGPYSQAVACTGFLFISGQLPVDPKTGEMIAGGIGEKTHRILGNIRDIAAAAGTDLNHVVKTTVFLTDMQDFNEMNAVYAQYFEGCLPARSTVQVAALPKQSVIEIEAVASLPPHGGEIA